MYNPYEKILSCEAMQMTKAQEALAQGLCRMAGRQPYGQISVSALCQEAKTARSTFYVYYQNIDELLNSMEDNLIVGLLAHNTWVTDCDGTDLPFEIYDSTLAYIRANRAAFRTFLVDRPNIHFIEKWKAAIKYHLAERCLLTGQSIDGLDLRFEILASFVITGHTYLLKHDKPDDWQQMRILLHDWWPSLNVTKQKPIGNR